MTATTMKAVRLHPSSDSSNPYSPTNPASASALKLDAGLAVPNISPGELLVKVEATTVVRDMLTWPESYLHEYQVLGHDFAGTVIKTVASSEEDTTAFRVGDHIFGMIDPERAGAWSEYAVVKENEAWLKPAHLTWSQAASVPLTGLTAFQALFVHAGVPVPLPLNLDASTQGVDNGGGSGSILITGATGSVGLYLVQLARLAALHVVAATRTAARNRELLTQLGADEVVEYDDGLFNKTSKRFGIIIDTVGGVVLEKCWSIVEDAGTLVSVESASYNFVEEHREKSSSLDKNEQHDKHVKAKFFIVTPSQRDLKGLSTALESGLLKSFVAREFPLAEVQRAYTESETGSAARGKIILRMGEPGDVLTEQ